MNQSHTPQASPATFTPTHTAEGRKLTRAERKAANKAKWAAMQAAKAAERKQEGKRLFEELGWSSEPGTPAPKRKQAPKPKRKGKAKPKTIVLPPLDPAVWEQAGTPAPKRKPKRKGKRKPTANERLEAQAQRASIRKQEGKRAKEQAKATKVVGVDNVKVVDGRIVGFDVVDAQACERRTEVPVEVQERKRPVLESEPLSDYDGLTLTEAANLRKHLWMLEQDVCMDDCL
jgi:hypothetical protein